MGSSSSSSSGRRAKALEDEPSAYQRRCGGGETWERCYAGTQQLFVRGLNGRSIAVDVDLDEDVVHLAQALAARDRKSRASVPSLRFTFGGRQLEPGVPLWKYGLCKGSNVVSLACPWAPRRTGSTFRSGWCSTPRGSRRAQRSSTSSTTSSSSTVAAAWEATTSSSTQAENTRSPSETSTQTAPVQAELAEARAKSGRGSPASASEPRLCCGRLSKTVWLEMPVTITTPFAEVDGTLGYPEHLWETCKLSPRVLRRMARISDVMGVHAPRQETLSFNCWRLRMRDLHPFPCVQPPLFADIWQRLQATTARIEIWSPPEALLGDIRPLVNEDDEVCLGSVDRGLVKGLHISVLLLRDAELAVDDVTVRFREPERGHAAGKSEGQEEVCCVCLEPMLAGEMCRRLACLHCLHAGCAMTLLPEVPCCPVCRSSIVPASPVSQSSGDSQATSRSLMTEPYY